MLIRYLSGLLISLVLCSCSSDNFDKKISLEDVTKMQKISLEMDKERYVHSVRMKATGNIDGDAILNVIGDEGVEYTIRLTSGAINQPINKEWYSKTCILEYKPEEVKTGSIWIQYEFKYVK